MKWTHIYKRDFATGSVKIVATCVLGADNRVELRGDDEKVIAKLEQGILVPAKEKTLTVEDGEQFLSALKNEFRSLELVATDVQEGEQITYTESAD